MRNPEGGGGGAATFPNGARPGSTGGSTNEFGGVRSSQYDAQTSASRASLPAVSRPPPPDPTNPQLTPPADQPRRGSPRPVQQPPVLHPELRSVLQLTVAHARKVYFSGPLVRRLERQPDGSRPAKDDGWTDVWAQLGGTTLSIWDMKAIADASKEGKEVPPTYINVQDAVSSIVIYLRVGMDLC
jgi:CCR4-NOT transcriptional complex subunit CAF120